MTVYVVVNGKGGVGKTTTAVELVAALRRAGRSVCGLDLDQQANMTVRCGVTPETEIYDVAADVVSGAASITDAAIAAPAIPGAHVVVGTHELSELNPYTVSDLVTGLRDHLASTTLPWDDVVIDCPPNLEGVTQAGLAAADVIVVATSCEWDALEQISRLEARIEARIAPRIRPGATIGWVVPTKYHAGRTLDRDVLSKLHATYPGKVTSPVRDATDVGKAYNARQPVSTYRPRSAVAGDYIDSLGHIVRTTTTSRSAS